MSVAVDAQAAAVEGVGAHRAGLVVRHRACGRDGNGRPCNIAADSSGLSRSGIGDRTSQSEKEQHSEVLHHGEVQDSR